MIHTLIGLIVEATALVVVFLFWVMTRDNFNEDNNN